MITLLPSYSDDDETLLDCFKKSLCLIIIVLFLIHLNDAKHRGL